MEQEELQVALSNIGWKAELPGVYASKSGVVTVCIDEEYATIYANGSFYCRRALGEFSHNRLLRSVTCGDIDLKAQD
jgi:hypothetical protein